MQVTVAMPAAWCLAPLQEIDWINDPDIDDDPPRYDRPLAAGWEAVHEGVMSIYASLQAANLDVLDRSFQTEVTTELTRSQESIVYGWFFQGEAPQWTPESDSWLNGRHRTWGLKSQGFALAPCLVMPVGDAIDLWDDESDWGPLDWEAVSNQKSDLNWWMTNKAARPWRGANPGFAPRWAEIIERWERRLSTP